MFIPAESTRFTLIESTEHDGEHYVPSAAPEAHENSDLRETKAVSGDGRETSELITSWRVRHDGDMVSD